MDGKEVNLLAESPRQLVFESPQDVTGKTVLHLKERDVEIEGAYRSLGVRLYAPTTELTRGQTTTLSAAVDGLTGLTEEIPLDLKTSGVVSMAGGDEQLITIRPADVGPGGSCSFERTITGIQTGSFNVVATVKVPETTIRISEPTNGATVGEPRPKFTWTVEHAPAPMTYAVKIVEGEPGSPLQEATLGFPHWVGEDILQPNGPTLAKRLPCVRGPPTPSSSRALWMAPSRRSAVQPASCSGRIRLPTLRHLLRQPRLRRGQGRSAAPTSRERSRALSSDSRPRSRGWIRRK